MALVVILPGEESSARAARIFRFCVGGSKFRSSRTTSGAACCDAGLWLVTTHSGQQIELGEGTVLVCLENCRETILARRAHLLLGERLSIPSGVLAA